MARHLPQTVKLDGGTDHKKMRISLASTMYTGLLLSKRLSYSPVHITFHVKIWKKVGKIHVQTKIMRTHANFISFRITLG